MLLLPEGTLGTSASELTLPSSCEFAFLRRLDQLRGHIERIDAIVDALLDRTTELGDAHEMRIHGVRTIRCASSPSLRASTGCIWLPATPAVWRL
jgi:hypothetical protein